MSDKVGGDESGPTRVVVGYYYISGENLDLLSSFTRGTGHKESGLVTQFVRGWLSIHRERYLRLAIADAKSRGLTFSEWGRIVIRGGFEDLPEGGIGIFPEEPLNRIDIGKRTVRRRLNYMNLGMQNTALLRAAVYYADLSLVEYVSRVVCEHINRNWESRYASQVRANDLTQWDEEAEMLIDFLKPEDLEPWEAKWLKH